MLLNKFQTLLIGIVLSGITFFVGYGFGYKNANLKCTVENIKIVETNNKILSLNNKTNLILSFELSNIKESSALKTKELIHEKNSSR